VLIRSGVFPLGVTTKKEDTTKSRFLHLYLLFFIFLYAEMKCLQHSVTYHGRVIVRLIVLLEIHSVERGICPIATSTMNELCL